MILIKTIQHGSPDTVIEAKTLSLTEGEHSTKDQEQAEELVLDDSKNTDSTDVIEDGETVVIDNVAQIAAKPLPKAVATKKVAVMSEEDEMDPNNNGTGAWADAALEREYENAEYGDELSDGSYKMHPDSGCDPG